MLRVIAFGYCISSTTAISRLHPPFYRRDSDLGSHPPYLGNHKNHHKVLCRLYSEIFLSGQVAGKQTAPCDQVTEDILKL